MMTPTEEKKANFKERVLEEERKWILSQLEFEKWWLDELKEDKGLAGARYQDDFDQLIDNCQRRINKLARKLKGGRAHVEQTELHRQDAGGEG